MKRIFIVFLLLIVFLFQYSCIFKPHSGTWEQIGLEDKTIYRLVLSDSQLYACAGKDGLWMKNINKNNSEWQYLGMADSALVDYPGRGVKDVVINPENRDELLIAFDAVGHETPEVYRSTDNGENWVAADSGLIYYNGGYKYSIRIEALCYANDYILGGGSGIHKTYDFGLSWEPASPQEVGAFECVMVRHNTITDVVWLGGTNTISQAVLESSIDGGSTWRTYENFGEGDLNWGYVSCIAIHPYDTNTVYVGMDNKIKKTTNGGNSWEICSAGIYSDALIIDPENSSHLWTAAGVTVRESFDAGITWVEIETPIESNIREMILDENKRKLYFGTVSGIFCYNL